MFSNVNSKTIGHEKEKISIGMTDHGDIIEILGKKEKITYGSKNTFISKSLDLSDNADSFSSNSNDSQPNYKILEKLRSHLVLASTVEKLTHAIDCDISFFSTDKRLGNQEIEDRIKSLIVLEKILITAKKTLEDKRKNLVAKVESENYSSDCSSQSIISSDSIENSETLEMSSLSQLGSSSRERLTRAWVNSFTYDSYKHVEESVFVDSVNEFDDDFNFTEDLTEDSSSTDTKSSAKFESNSSGSSIIFSEAVTEENYNIHRSLFTKGSLFDLEEDFGSIEDVETMYSRTNEICSDWEDVVKGGSEFSQSFMNEGFIIEDIFEKPVCSKVLHDANQKWENSMANVKDTPRDPVKISFAPPSSLVTVHHYEKFEEEDLSYDFYALDRLRFQRRINDFSVLMSPFLTAKHRTNVLLRNMHLL